MKIILNPVGFEAEHLSALNRSFGPWGDAHRWQWCFARPCSARPTDIIIAELDGAAIAGTGISYRRLIMPRGHILLAGILTAAWSFPVKSARGAYMRVMSEAMRRIAEQGGAVALGFMPQNKSSGHQLLRADAMAAVTAYVSTSGRPNAKAQGRLKSCLVTATLVEELFRRMNRRAEGALSFVYSGIGEFIGQFIERPNPVQIFVDGTGCYFIFEYLPHTMNLLAVLPEAGNAPSWRERFMEARYLADEQERGLFAYASNELVISEAVAAGLVAKPGFMTVTITSPSDLSAAMATSADEDVASACLTSFRTLHVENGDRI